MKHFYNGCFKSLSDNSNISIVLLVFIFLFLFSLRLSRFLVWHDFYWKLGIVGMMLRDSGCYWNLLFQLTSSDTALAGKGGGWTLCCYCHVGVSLGSPFSWYRHPRWSSHYCGAPVGILAPSGLPLILLAWRSRSVSLLFPMWPLLPPGRDESPGSLLWLLWCLSGGREGVEAAHYSLERV